MKHYNNNVPDCRAAYSKTSVTETFFNTDTNHFRNLTDRSLFKCPLSKTLMKIHMQLLISLLM